MEQSVDNSVATVTPAPTTLAPVAIVSFNLFLFSMSALKYTLDSALGSNSSFSVVLLAARVLTP